MKLLSSSQAKGGISYSPECHISPHISVLFQPAVEDPQGCGPLGLAIISLYLVSHHCPHQFLGSRTISVNIDHVVKLDALIVHLLVIAGYFLAM